MSKNQKQYKEEEEGIRTEELNWFYRIITLGDRFSWKDFGGKAFECNVHSPSL